MIRQRLECREKLLVRSDSDRMISAESQATQATLTLATFILATLTLATLILATLTLGTLALAILTLAILILTILTLATLAKCLSARTGRLSG